MFSHPKMMLAICHYLSCYVQSVVLLGWINAWYAVVVFPIGRRWFDCVTLVLLATLLFLVEFPLWEKRMK